jgi:phospholipid/cholesterol/gamma-HCH transport system substrate-binding protein
MTGSLSHKQTVLLGLVVVVVLGLGLLALFAIGDGQGLWREQFHVTARFSKINGLEVGTRVRIQGVNAGQVAAIEQPAERGGEVLVRLRVERRFRELLGIDAQAEIISEGLIGGKSVELHPGSPHAALLADGAVIPGRADLVMDELRKLAGQSDELLDEVHGLARQTKQTMAEAQELLRDLRQGEGAMGKEIAGTLRQVKDTSASVEHGFDQERTDVRQVRRPGGKAPGPPQP